MGLEVNKFKGLIIKDLFLFKLVIFIELFLFKIIFNFFKIFNFVWVFLLVWVCFLVCLICCFIWVRLDKVNFKLIILIFCIGFIELEIWIIFLLLK